MGRGFQAKCPKCNNIFDVMEGMGFMGIIKHCNKCGVEKFVEIAQIKKYFPHTIMADIQDTDFDKLFEQCKYGGSFRDKAPYRCPQCGETGNKSHFTQGQSPFEVMELLWD